MVDDEASDAKASKSSASIAAVLMGAEESVLYVAVEAGARGVVCLYPNIFRVNAKQGHTCELLFSTHYFHSIPDSIWPSYIFLSYVHQFENTRITFD